MSEKIKGLMPWILTFFAAAMGIASFFLIFAPSVTYDAYILGENSFKGLHTALGYIRGDITVLHASAGMIIAYLFPLLGAATAVIGKDNMIARIAATALFLVGGALSFAATALVRPVFTATATLGLGSIFSGVTAMLGACSEGAYCILFRK